MAVSLLLAALWALVAVRAGTAPRSPSSSLSLGLLMTGVPLLGLITMQMGPVGGLVGLVLGGCLIGWPLIARSAAQETEV